MGKIILLTYKSNLTLFPYELSNHLQHLPTEHNVTLYSIHYTLHTTLHYTTLHINWYAYIHIIYSYTHTYINIHIYTSKYMYINAFTHVYIHTHIFNKRIQFTYH